MAETIKIGGELESTATGNKVADASAVKDKAKGNKSQAEFNSDVVRHENEINGSNGLDQRLRTVEELAEISVGGGDIGIGTAADFESDDPSDLAKVPTVGAILGGLNDGIYDVSKRNPTAGPNSDGKFTLDYILDNANTLIPTSWRHGGMTISFVHTSDNNYVQYTLASQTFTTDVSYWQKEENVSKIVGGNLLANIPFDKIIYANGLYTNKTANNYACLLDVTDLAGQNIMVTPNSDNNGIIAFLANDDASTLNPRFCVNENGRHVVSIGSTETFTIPKDCKYLYVVVFNNNKGAHPSIVVTSVESQLVKDNRHLNQMSADNLVHSLGWFQTNIDPNKGHIGTQIATNRLISYLKVNGGNKIFYDLSGMYKIRFTVWDGVTLPVPSSTGWLTDKGLVNVQNNSIVLVTVANIRETDITTDILNGEDIVIKLWNNDRVNIESLLEPKIKLINAGIIDSTLTPNFSQTNRVSNSSIYLKRGVGTALKFAVTENYQIAFTDFNDSKTVINKTGWINEKSGYYEVKNGNIVVLFRKTDDSTITVDEIEQNMSIELYDEVQWNDIKEVFKTQFANVPGNNFPISWKQGTIRDNGSNIGTIQLTDSRICDLVEVSYYSNDKIWFVLDDGYHMYFGDWDGKTNPMPTSTGWLYGNGEYNIPSGAKYIRFGAGKNSNAVIEPTDGEQHIHLFTNKDAYDSFVTERAIQKPYKYTGEKIVLEHGFNASLYKTFQNWSNMQGGAIYEDKLVCLMATDELNSPTANGFIYDLNTGEKLHNLLFGSTLGNKTYSMPHANQVSFGTAFYNENSRFPLLYVSQVNGSTQALWEASERGVLVYDLQTEDDGETFTPVLVQAIIPDLTTIDPETERPVIENYIGKYTPNYIVDSEKNQFVILGYPNESWFSLTGQQPVAILDIPSINDGTEVVFGSDDIVDSYKFPVSLGIQQSFYYDGKIYTLGGFAAHGNMRCINLTKKEVVTTIDLSQWTLGEPQFAGYWNHKFLYYNAGNDGSVYELEF